jgi:hypothetical protein
LQSSIEGTLGVASSKNELTNALGPERSELVTEDLATFLVAHYIVVTKNDSVRSIAEYFRATPDVAGCVEEILCQLENSGLISISGDKVTFNKQQIDIGNNPEVLSRFLPRLFKISVDRLLTNAKDGVIRRNKEGLRYFVLPDNPEVASEAKALYLEYKTKMLALIEKAEKQNLKSDGIRLVGSFNCALNPEDFA